MKKVLKLSRILMIAAVIFVFAASCATTGSFMPLEAGETVIGTVQTSFAARNTLNGKDALNTQAYIKLLEAAQPLYAINGAIIDVREIVWVSGKDIDPQNKEYAAAGKVIKIR